jgi:uncharacterized protein DUF1579
MKRTSVRLIGILLLTSAAIAQMAPPKPGPELRKLDYFLGDWNSEGEAKPGPMGPGGKFTTSGHGDWMAGRFFLVVHSGFKGGAMGDATGTAYMGYNTDEKVYTYDEFNSMGESVHAKGTLDGDTWNWTNEFKMGPQNVKGRYTMKILSPESYTFKFETSADGTKWDTAMEGKATKK